MTGDKIETAINIGVSAKLLDDTMDQYIIDGQEYGDLHRTLSEIELSIKKAQGRRRKQAIIVAGHSLIHIDTYSELKELFLSASEKSDVVLACRVSPK